MWSVEINSLNRKDMETVVMIRMLNANPAGMQSFKISAQTLGIQLCDTCFSKIPFWICPMQNFPKMNKNLRNLSFKYKSAKQAIYNH